MSMAEHTQLFILESKLKRLRILRPISQFLAYLVGFLYALILTIYWIPFFGVLIGFLVGAAFSMILKRYYDMKEKQVREQIHKQKLWKGYR
jgi:4-hydroxybenzoate polyprenyltransferase